MHNWFSLFASCSSMAQNSTITDPIFLKILSWTLFLALILNFKNITLNNIYLDDWVVLFLSLFFNCLAVCRILVPQPGIESGPLQVWSPNHWTTREFPNYCFVLFFSVPSILHPSKKIFFCILQLIPSILASASTHLTLSQPLILCLKKAASRGLVVAF